MMNNHVQELPKKRRFVKANVVKIVEETPIYDLAKQTVPFGWERVFKEADKDLAHISRMLDERRMIEGNPYPLRKDIFRAFQLTPLNKVRVVIFGQDPYHGTGPEGRPQAMGLSFSVDHGFAIPPSLRNIYKEIKSEYPDWTIPNHGNLTHWAIQGVLLLNSCLTVLPGKAGSHSKFKTWHPFIIHVLKALEETNPKCIYVLWGAKAQTMKKWISPKATILEGPHPSPLSAYRGFFGCNHFRQINEMVHPPIEW